jgi:hypothetical protein
MFLLKISLKQRTKSAAVHRHAFVFCDVYHEGSERVVRNLKVAARTPGVAAIFALKGKGSLDGKFTGLVVG